jgi:outer membrane lipopolysaccharide assembly protein LptE/RlpB
MRNRLSIIISLVLTLLASGCGYRFAPAGEHIGREIRTVYIENFSNHTSEAHIENYIRAAFIDQFIMGGRFTLVYEKETSDAVLSGKVTGLSTSHVSYEQNDMAREDSVFMSADLKFKSREGSILWAKKSLSGREAYSVDQDYNITSKNRKETLRKLSRDMAEKAYRDIMSGF